MPFFIEAQPLVSPGKKKRANLKITNTDMEPVGTRSNSNSYSRDITL